MKLTLACSVSSHSVKKEGGDEHRNNACWRSKSVKPFSTSGQENVCMYVKTEIIIIIMHEQIAGIGFMLWRAQNPRRGSRCHIVRVFVTYVAGKRGWGYPFLLRILLLIDNSIS